MLLKKPDPKQIYLETENKDLKLEDKQLTGKNI